MRRWSWCQSWMKEKIEIVKCAQHFCCPTQHFCCLKQHQPIKIMYDDDAVMTMKQASNMFDVHFTSQVIHSKMFVLLLNIQTPENHCFFWADLKSIHQVKHHSNLLFASKIIKYTLLPLKYLFHHFQFCHHLKHKICIATKSTSFMPLTPTWVNIVTISHICTRAHICLRRRIIYNYTGSRGVLVERS